MVADLDGGNARAMAPASQPLEQHPNISMNAYFCGDLRALLVAELLPDRRTPTSMTHWVAGQQGWHRLAGALMLVTAIIVTSLVLLVIAGGVVEKQDRDRYHRDVAAWASTRGWTYRKGGGGRTWTTPLPGAANRFVQLQVDGTHTGHEFTLVYANVIHPGGFSGSTIRVQWTVVVVHLRSTYPAVEIAKKWFGPLRTSTTIGHTAFDQKFRIRTKAPGGPAAAVPVLLAEAHAAEEVPLWLIRDRELICYVAEKIQPEDLDTMLGRALRVADLLGIA